MYTQEEIVVAAAKSNLCRQSKTVGTAFHQPSLFDALGPCADNEANCLGVLDGTFVPYKDADPFAVSHLETMIKPQSLKDKCPINCIPTPVNNIEAWRKQNDNTGVLFGVPNNAHHICCTYDPTLNEIDCMMRSAPLEFDFTPDKWCSFDDVEILKKAGELNIDKMRLIMLMYPQFQMNNKNIGRKVLANAEICNEVAKGQHGSRKFHQAGLLLLNKVLVGDLFRLSRFSACYAMNDAKGCYDCIDHTFAILVLMYYGIAWSIARNCFQVLQQGRHRIKTGYGLSKPVYGNEDPQEPIEGIGQGNGMGPSLWCLMSIIVIKDCKQNGHGTTIITAISRKIASLLGFAFVDDANLTTAASNAQTSGTENDSQDASSDDALVWMY